MTVLPPFAAFIWSTTAPRVSVPTRGARLCAWVVALLTASFAAKLRSTSASGTRRRPAPGSWSPDEQDDAESHPGALSLIPTPRTVCR